MVVSEPSRRNLMELLGAVLGSTAFVPLAGCSTSKSKSTTATAPAEDGTTPPGEGPDLPVPPPEFDVAALSDALGLALAAMPVDADVDALMAGAQEQINALHEAGLTETAAWTTTAIDSVVTGILGGFGAAFPENGPLDAEQSKQVADDLLASLSTGCASLSGNIDAVAEEMRTYLGTDTVEPVPEVALELGQQEVALRQWMHKQSAEGGNLSGQSLSQSAIRELQRARVRASTNQSITQMTEGLTAAMGVLASGGESGTTARRAALGRSPERPFWRTRVGAPPPPDDISDFCDTFTAITFIVDMTLGLKGLIQAGDAAANAAAQRFTEFLDEVDDIGSDAQYLLDRYWTWVAADVSEEVVAQATAKLQSQAEGAIVAELQEEECNFFAAVLLTCFFILSLVAWFSAFIGAITKIAVLIGATPSGGLIALLFILMIVAILYFVLQMVCMVATLKPTLDALFGTCE